MSNMHDLLHDGRPVHDALELYGSMDSDWAACLRTRRSMGGAGLFLAGGIVAYKISLLVMIALSSTEAEFMEAVLGGKIILFCRSIL